MFDRVCLIVMYCYSCIIHRTTQYIHIISNGEWTSYNIKFKYYKNLISYDSSKQNHFQIIYSRGVIQKPCKYLWLNFFVKIGNGFQPINIFIKNSIAEAVNYSREKLHLRCFTGFWIRLCFLLTYFLSVLLLFWNIFIILELENM